jgi:predicted nucleic acid-binding protein
LLRLFGDAAFFVALLLPRDDLHTAAHDARRLTHPRDLVTSDPVLVEVLAHVSELGPRARARAVALVDELRMSDVEVIRQTPELLDGGLELYRRRTDKGYSLTDCMCMEICNQLGIREVLTHDRHFTQEGFTILL